MGSRAAAAADFGFVVSPQRTKDSQKVTLSETLKTTVITSVGDCDWFL